MCNELNEMLLCLNVLILLSVFVKIDDKYVIFGVLLVNLLFDDIIYELVILVDNVIDVFEVVIIYLND